MDRDRSVKYAKAFSEARVRVEEAGSLQGEQLKYVEKRSLQERFEESRWGRALLSTLILVLIGGVVSWNLPESELRRRLVPVLAPLMYRVGLDQNWAVFSPEPPKKTFDVFARIEYADKTKATWRVPDLKGPFISPYRYYRWRKFSEFLRRDSGAHLREPFARWLIRSELTNDSPVHIFLLSRSRRIGPPGVSPPTEDWVVFQFYSFNVLLEDQSQ